MKRSLKSAERFQVEIPHSYLFVERTSVHFLFGFAVQHGSDFSAVSP